MADITAWFGQMLTAIQNRIVSEVPEIRWIDQDLGQLDFYEGERPAVAWPCVLVDFTTTTYDEFLESVQAASATIQFRLGFPPYSATDQKAPLKVRANGLKYYELEEKLFKAFQHWDADELCQPMTRTSGITERREDPIRIRVMTFTTTFHDSSAVPETEKAQRPKIKFEFLK